MNSKEKAINTLSTNPELLNLLIQVDFSKEKNEEFVPIQKIERSSLGKLSEELKRILINAKNFDEAEDIAFALYKQIQTSLKGVTLFTLKTNGTVDINGKDIDDNMLDAFFEYDFKSPYGTATIKAQNNYLMFYSVFKNNEVIVLLINEDTSNINEEIIRQLNVCFKFLPQLVTF